MSVGGSSWWALRGLDVGSKVRFTGHKEHCFWDATRVGKRGGDTIGVLAAVGLGVEGMKTGDEVEPVRDVAGDVSTTPTRLFFTGTAGLLAVAMRDGVPDSLLLRTAIRLEVRLGIAGATKPSLVH